MDNIAWDDAQEPERVFLEQDFLEQDFTAGF
jgi:hypothetical protein